MSAPPAGGSPAAFRLTAATLVPLGIVSVVWGCNWPLLKLGVAEIAPLTFRTLTIPFAALGLFVVAKIGGESLRVPRALWGRIAMLALTNVSGWNGLLLFGLRELPTGRAVVPAFTTPVWAVLLGLALLHEPLSRRKVAGIALGMAGMAILAGDDLVQNARVPGATLLIVGAAMSSALGIVLLRRWKPPMAQTVITAWMLLLGSLPLMLLAPFFAPGPAAAPSAVAIFAILYNVFIAGTLGHWAFFTVARTLPAAVSSMSSLPVPVIGVFSAMWVLGERPGWSEWIALGFVVAAMAVMLWPPRAASPAASPAAPRD